MKKMLQILFIACLFYSIGLNAQRVSSNLNNVTVFLKGAVVNRTLQMNLSPGTNEVIIEGLSNFIDDKTILLEGTGSTNATILSVDYRINPLKYQDEDMVGRALKKTLDSLSTKYYNIQNERLAYEQELQMLKENHRLPAKEKSIFIDDLEEAADFIRKRSIEIRNKISQLQPLEQDLQVKVNDVQEQFNQRGSNYRAPSGEIVVRLSSTNYGKADFTLRYYVTNAGWAPSYSLRAENMAEPLNLNYDAVVWQRTGEQWKNVKLTLTTTTPSSGINQPVFNTWYVDVYRGHTYGNINQESINTRGARQNSNVYYIDGIRVPDDKHKVETSSAYTTAVQGTVNVSFDINLRYDIPSDGTPRYIRVQQTQLPAKYTYTALPRQTQGAFLTAKVTDWEEQNLLPGNASLFMENTYVGKTYLDPNASADTMVLYFGRDEQIVIDRNKIKSSARKQFMGSNKIETFEYVIALRNAKSRPVTLTVIDQVPVSQNKDIEVSLKESSKGQYDAATGKITWQITLQPGESKALQFQYNVKYPKAMIVSGLY